MPSHIHLLVRTPEPNLSSGMQHWLSGYANWYAKRNRRSGPLFQGRYKSFLASGREMAALLCRRYTPETLLTLSKRFGLQGADSSSNLVRKARRREEESSAYRRKMARIENKLRLKTGNQSCP